MVAIRRYKSHEGHTRSHTHRSPVLRAHCPLATKPPPPIPSFTRLSIHNLTPSLGLVLLRARQSRLEPLYLTRETLPFRRRDLPVGEYT